MKPNIGDGERLIRVILGIYVMLLGFLFIQGVVGIILGILGLIAFATGASGWCGIYTLMGKSTLKTSPDEPEEMATEDEAAAPEQPATEGEKAEDSQPDEVVDSAEDERLSD
mgnify:CR=1 FL=1